MVYVESIKFKEPCTVQTNRKKHLSMFKIVRRTYKERNRNYSRRTFGSRTTTSREPEYKKVSYKEFNIFEKDFVMNFRDLTIIVGDNGSGKSSLLNYLKPPKSNASDYFSFHKSAEEQIKEAFATWLNNKTVKLNFVANPELIVIEKSMHKTDFIERIGKGKIHMSANDIFSRWETASHSNGETTLDFLQSMKDLKNSIIILDEPETSLSIKSQIRIRKMLKKLSKTNQIILVTHSQIFMQLTKEVYDFEEKSYVETSTYINNQYK